MWSLGCFSWSWFLEGKNSPWSKGHSTGNIAHIFLWKPYGKFQKNMDLVLRKPLEEIFDIQIFLGIYLDSSEMIDTPIFSLPSIRWL